MVSGTDMGYSAADSRAVQLETMRLKGEGQLLDLNLLTLVEEKMVARLARIGPDWGKAEAEAETVVGNLPVGWEELA
ncbi:hypothetical protein MMC30_004825 [Trapelia coarctata]|nr:hypothetical protein [Trapelia coarctata]